MNKGYFITGIGTEVGKTYTSGLILKNFKVDYWKPIQCGDLNATDSMKMQEIKESNQLEITIFPERFQLKTPASPHWAAEKEEIEISLQDFSLPNSSNLIVEGAGGLLVPINQKETMLDLIKHLNLPVIVVSRNYLGSINHTLLTYQCLAYNGLKVAGIIFNGQTNKSTESIILSKTNLKLLGKIEENDFTGEWFEEIF